MLFLEQAVLDVKSWYFCVCCVHLSLLRLDSCILKLRKVSVFFLYSFKVYLSHDFVVEAVLAFLFIYFDKCSLNRLSAFKVIYFSTWVMCRIHGYKEPPPPLENDSSDGSDDERRKKNDKKEDKKNDGGEKKKKKKKKKKGDAKEVTGSSGRPSEKKRKVLSSSSEDEDDQPSRSTFYITFYIVHSKNSRPRIFYVATIKMHFLHRTQ